MAVWPILTRNIVFSAHEALMGRETPSIVRRLAEAEALPRDRIDNYQRQHLAALCEHARSTCPYWQQRLRAHCDPRPLTDGQLHSGEQTVASTWNAPILTRAEIRRNRETMRSRAATGKLIHHSSSGTTDDNLVFYLDRQRQAWDRASRIHALSRLGIAVGDKQLHFMPHFPCGGPLGSLKDAARRVRDHITRDPAFDLRPMTPERMDAALLLLDKYRPALLVGYPSMLFALARRRLEATVNRRTASPRYVLSTGEVLYEFQRHAIELAFSARVVEEYGSQELGLIASEDAAGEWRVNWPHVYVEVLRNGRAVRPGETGELVVTCLHSHAMPFLRYATGDVVTLPTWVSEESTRHTLPPIEGRTSDMLVATDGRLQSNRELVDLLVRETGITEFSLHQTRPDRLLCMTVRENGWVGHEGIVTDVLRSILGRSLRVEWKIGAAFQPLKSGKRRYICSSLALAALAHDRESGMFLSRAWPQRVLDAA